LRRVRRRKGRRNLADFENIPVTTHVHELGAEERACPCCGAERQEIGAEESWQIEYYPGHFERIQHLRKKYACPTCESNGDGAQIQAAAKPESAIDKGLAGPGLLSYIVTSKFSDYLPLYRLEDIFQRQGFEISRATQSVWCGDVADLVEPLYELMAQRVRASHVVPTDDTIMPMLAKGKAAKARMWVYVGDEAGPYNIFDFTLNRGRDGPKYFLKDYRQVLLADAYGGYNGVVAGNDITRAGCWAHARRKIVEAEKAAPEIAREAVEWVRALYAVEHRGKNLPAAARLELRQAESAPVLAGLKEKLLTWKQQLLPKHPDGGGGELCAGPVGRAERVLLRRRRAHRQQRQRARDEAGGAQSQELAVRGQRARRPDGGHSGEPDQQLPPARCGPATLPDAVAGEPARGAAERARSLAAG
jgi:transposase